MARAVSSGVLLLFLWAPVQGQQQLPPVPVPGENPLSETKRILGKILFWDEQLSSDNTVACGTCHIPANGGADPRDPNQSIHPGANSIFGDNDDVVGSLGVVRRDVNGNPVNDPLFGTDAQVTGRAAQSYFGMMWVEDAFWDGRARSQFTDPLNPNNVVIADGGALESQAVGPILSSVEMAKDGRQWSEVVDKLARITPMALASDLPLDMAAAIQSNPTYPDLFNAAFGDPAITPVRIAFAIATYERTLVPDQTPWDLGTMTQAQADGFTVFEDELCANCHTPPLFTDNNFFNIGLRPSNQDIGRQAVTNVQEDAGEMKTPSLRNIGLRRTFMHTGEFTTIDDVIGHYNNPAVANDRDLIPGGGNYNFGINGGDRNDLVEFLTNALTDPRVAAEQFPFDRPTLRSEAGPDAQAPSEPGNFQGVAVSTTAIDLSWDPASDNIGVADYRLTRDGVVIAMLTETAFQDTGLDTDTTFNYTLVARDAVTNESSVASILVSTGNGNPAPADVIVPGVTGLSEDDAITSLMVAELTVGMVDTAASNTVPAGNVIAQSPAAGTLVASNSAVDLTISLGPVVTVVDVPSVRRLAEVDARTALEAAGLAVGDVITARSRRVPEGDVISQDPLAGTLATPGTAVSLIVSSGNGDVQVPRFRRKKGSRARSEILSMALSIGNITAEYHDEVPEGEVISQNPEEGTLVAPETAVDLVISAGPLPESSSESAATAGISPLGALALALIGVAFAGRRLERGSQHPDDRTQLTAAK